MPDGDIAQLLDLAPIALIEKTEARKIGKRKRKLARVAEGAVRRAPQGRRERPQTSGQIEIRKREADLSEGRHEHPRSRYLPAEVRRAVWERDQGRCTFTSADGVRCTETGFLEFDHREPYACGGAATAENIRLTCRRHNQYLARLRFGSGKGRVREESPPYAGFPISFALVKTRATRSGASVRQAKLAGSRTRVLRGLG